MNHFPPTKLTPLEVFMIVNNLKLNSDLKDFIDNSNNFNNLTGTKKTINSLFSSKNISESDFILSQIQNNNNLYEHLPVRVRDNLPSYNDIVGDFSDYRDLKNTTPANNRAIIREIATNPDSYKNLDSSFLADNVIATIAILGDTNNINFINKDLLQNSVFVKSLLNSTPNIYKSLDNSFGQEGELNNYLISSGLNKYIKPTENGSIFESKNKINSQSNVNFILSNIFIPFNSPHWRTILHKLSIVAALNDSYGLPPLHPHFVAFLASSFHAEEVHYEKLALLNKRPPPPNSDILKSVVKKFIDKKPIDSNGVWTFMLEILAAHNKDLEPLIKTFLLIFNNAESNPYMLHGFSLLSHNFQNSIYEFNSNEDMIKLHHLKFFDNLYKINYTTTSGYIRSVDDVLEELGLEDENKYAIAIKIIPLLTSDTIKSEDRNLLKSYLDTLILNPIVPISSFNINDLARLPQSSIDVLISDLESNKVAWDKLKPVEKFTDLNYEQQKVILSKDYYEGAHKSLSDNPIFIQNASITDAAALSGISDKEKLNERTLVNHVFYHPEVLRYLIDQNNPLLDNPEVLIKIINRRPSSIKYLLPKLKSFQSLLITTLTENPNLLFSVAEYLPEDIIKDDFFRIIMSKSPANKMLYDYYLLTGNFDLKIDKDNVDILLPELIQSTILKMAPHVKDIESAIKLLDKSPTCFDFLPNEVKQNKAVIISKLKLMSLYKTPADKRAKVADLIPFSLRGDKEVVLEALRSQNSLRKAPNFSWISNSLLEDKSFIEEAIKTHGYILNSIPSSVVLTKDQIITALRATPTALGSSFIKSLHNIEEFTENENLIKELITKDGRSLLYASDSLELNPEFILLAMNTYPEIYKSLPDSLKEDPTFYTKAILSKSSLCSFLPESVNKDSEAIYNLVSTRPSLLSDKAFVSGHPEYSSDKELIYRLIKDNPFALFSIKKGNVFSGDKSLILEALKSAKALNIDIGVNIEGRSSDFLASLQDYVPEEYSFFLDSKDPIATIKEALSVEKNLLLADKNKTLEILQDKLSKDYKFLFNSVNPQFFNDPNFCKQVFRLSEESYTYVKNTLDKTGTFTIRALKNNGSIFNLLNPKDKNNKNNIRSAIYTYPELLQDKDLSDSFKDDPTLLIKLCKSNPLAGKFLSEKLKSDEKFMEELIGKVPSIIGYLEPVLTYFNDKKHLLLLAVKQDNSTFNLLPESYQNDPKFVKELLESNPGIFRFIDKNISIYSDLISIHNKQVLEISQRGSKRVRTSFESNSINELKNSIISMPILFDTIPEELKINRAFAFSLIKDQPKVYQYLPESLKSDKSLVIKMLEKDPTLLNLVPDSLSYIKDKKDFINYLKDSLICEHDLIHFDDILSKKDYILSVVHKHPEILSVVDTNYFKDDSFLLSLISKNGLALQYLPESIKQNKDICLEAVSNCGLALEFLPIEFQNNRELILTAIQNNGNSIKFAPKEYQNNRDLVLKSVQSNPESFEFILDEFKSDREIIELATKGSGRMLLHVPEGLRDESLIRFAINNDASVISELPLNIKYNIDFIGLAIENKPEIIFDLDKKFLLDNKQLIAKAINSAKDKDIFNKDFEVAINSIKPNFILFNPVPKEHFEEEVLKSNKIKKSKKEYIKDIVNLIKNDNNFSIEKFESLPEKIKNNPMIINFAIESNPLIYFELKTEQKNSVDNIVKAIENIKRKHNDPDSIIEKIYKAIPNSIKEQVSKELSTKDTKIIEDVPIIKEDFKHNFN